MNHFDRHEALWRADKRQLAEDLRTAFYARDASRFEALLKEIEPPPSDWQKTWLKQDPILDRNNQEETKP
jgi:hypothetical protein